MPSAPRVVRRSASTDADAPARKRSRSDRGEPAEGEVQPPGLIRNITLKNFMCHQHLTLDLNSHITFIKGQNGSGKSAVLTAVMVGLGARASATHRGSSVKSLIRTDQKSAVISVTLANTGDYAFLPAKYGDSITIERTLRDTGSGTYRIARNRGGLGPMEKGELAAILDGLSIQVDNPLVILTQETSKNFLRGEDAKKKYQLFQEATRLSHIARWYEKTRKNELTARAALDLTEESMKTRKKRVKELEWEVNMHKNRENIKQKIETLKLNVLWAKVIEEETALQEATKQKTKMDTKVQAIASKTEQVEKELEERGDFREKKTRLEAELGEERRQVEQRKKQLRDLAGEMRKADEGVRVARSRGKAKTRERQELQAEIERQRNESQPDYAAESQRRQQEKAALEAEVAELTATERTRAAHLQQVAGSVQQQRQELRLAEEEARELDGRIKELDRQLTRCRASQTNPRAVFGPWVADVDREIERCWQQRRFRKKPIGPVGAYVRVRGGCEEWKPLVETCLAGVLRAYLVDDQSDLKVMSDILRQHAHSEREKPRVIASKFLSEIHDISRLGIDTSTGEHVSVWSVLEIDNPVVANAVIDQARAESVLLLRTEAEARDKLAHRERVPRGCAQALTKAGYRYYPDPSYRTYPVNVPRQARYLQVSMQEVITDLTRQQQERRADAQEASARHGPARAALREAERQEGEARRLLEEARRRQQGARRRLRDMAGQEEPEPVNLRALEEEVVELDAAIAALEASVEPLLEQKAGVEQRMAECREAYQQAEAAVQAKIGDLEGLRSEEERGETLRSELARLNALLEGRRRQQTELAETVETRQSSTRRATETAEAVGERTQPRKSVSELESRVRGLTKSLEDSAARPRLSDEEALRQYQEAQLEYQRTEEQTDDHRKTLDMISAMMRERDQALEKLRISLGIRVTSHFSTILEARNFGGGLSFDHAKQRLEITVSPGQLGSGGSQQARHTSQLSGGERSFSTIAFLMAMWSVVQSPFRMLDEYDVFMDDANRRIGHDMLVNNALELNSQFTFFTPLSIMGSHEGDDRISLFQMPAPQRRE